MNRETQDRLDHGLAAVLEAERIILRHYQSSTLLTELKEDKSVVTAADREAEIRLRASISARFPDDAIVGEELQSQPGTSPYSWILDPIDGTQSFVCGVPLFGTLVGLLENGEPVAGIAHMPALKETYYGSKGRGAWWKPAGSSQPVRARVSSVSRLEESLFCTTSFSAFKKTGRKRLYDRLMSETRKFRGWGSCYGHMLVATGRVDFSIEPDVKIWDCAALFPIVTEAGGRFFDFSGTPRVDGGSAVSSNSAIEPALRELLAQTENQRV